jgi:glycosyltransferase involved in cell wall biosynthesis
LKVLLQNRSSFRNSVAGDGIQLLKTQEYLKKINIDVDVSCEQQVDLSKYDLVHLFNLMPVDEIYPLFRNARDQKKKIVLSTIYWNPEEFLLQNANLRHLKDWWQKSMPMREEMLREVDLILPNSKLELAMIQKGFSRVPKARIVINGVDRAYGWARPESFVNHHGWRDFLLSVGRICRRKNQLAIIQAAKNIGLPLVLLGPVNDGLYYRDCRRASAGHKVLFIDSLTQKDLSSAYAAARVHVLASWYDTPGLVSLEAALAGCTVVTTVRGCAKEYLGNLVHYCNPANGKSIEKAVEKAWLARKNPELKSHVLNFFTWERVAEQTLTAYKSVLESF